MSDIHCLVSSILNSIGILHSSPDAFSDLSSALQQRRLRKRNRRNTIMGDDFTTNQFFGDSSSNMNAPLDPPNMSQRHHNATPSISSGPGMAGHGTFQGGAAMYDTGAGAPGAGVGAGVAGRGATGYGATAASSAAVGGAGAVLHERPKYMYGRQGEDDVDDMAHGVYSSQPQPQVPYNPEAYGSYAAYSAPSAAAGYQEATREYQGPQQGGYAQGGYHDAHGTPYGATGNYGVAVADPGPSTTTGATGAHPTALPSAAAQRDPATMNGNRGQNTRSIVNDDDVYGGI